MNEKRRASSNTSLAKLSALTWSESTTSTRRNSVRSEEQPKQQQQHQHQDAYPPITSVSGYDEEAQQPMHKNRQQEHQQQQQQQHTKNETDDHADPYDPERPRLGFKQRLHHFTWAWYTLSMSTGGLALLLSSQRKTFAGLRGIGFGVYILNLVMFTIITGCMCARFVLHRGDFKRSVTHPREGFFVPTFFLALATIITGTDRYWIPQDDSRLSWAIQGTYWVYMALTLMLAIGQYSYVFAAHQLGLQTMMPTWILPIFPIMLSGTIASVIAKTQSQVAILPVLGAGLTCQGLGLSVAMLMYAHMIGRLMQTGLPHREHRPGLFMCVGPPAFTALALLGMANSLVRSPIKETVAVADDEVVGAGTLIVTSMILQLDRVVLYNLAVVGAIFLWALSLWWFGIAVVAVIQAPPKHFHLGWWACVFPNTGFTLATIAMAGEFRNEGVNWVTVVMSIFMVCVYLFVLISNIRAVWAQDIMYPGRDEDVFE